MPCVHHWNLDLNPAVCKHCGETRVFKAVIPYWGSYGWVLTADQEPGRHARATTKVRRFFEPGDHE